MRIRQSLMELIPPAYYSNGKESKCTIFRICNMFDVNSQSFKQVEEKKSMESKTYQPALENYDLGTLWKLRKEEEI